MVRKFVPAILVGLILASAASAQTAWRFRWEKGQVLDYRVEHVTAVVEIVKDVKNGFSSKLNLVKRWQVQDVDADGTATLQMSLVSMRNQMTRPDGETILYDSTDADKSDPQMKTQLSKYVGTTLAVLRVNSAGQVVEVKESKFGPASKFESDLPFKLAVPAADVKEGASWERKYTITLEPPQGTGEKYEAAQQCTCKSLKDGAATISLGTSLQKPPESVADQVPLLQMQPEGEAVFDVKSGRLRSAKLTTDKELKGHQGAGSSYHFQSQYTEELVERK
jgi:hypothetical protein